MSEPNKDKDMRNGTSHWDHPEQYPTENESLFDKFEDEQHVDPIPMEDLNMEKQEEKQKNGESKSSSSTASKYKTGFKPS